MRARPRYAYAGGSRSPSPSPQADALIAAYRADLLAGADVTPHMPGATTDKTYLARRNGCAPDGAEILERCLLSLANEGFKVLEDGTACSPRDVDAVWVHGYGFPRDLGGPLHWAEKVMPGGLPAMLAALERLSAAFPTSPHLKPSGLLAECVARKVHLDALCREKAKARAAAVAK